LIKTKEYQAILTISSLNKRKRKGKLSNMKIFSFNMPKSSASKINAKVVVLFSK